MFGYRKMLYLYAIFFKSGFESIEYSLYLPQIKSMRNIMFIVDLLILVVVLHQAG